MKPLPYLTPKQETTVNTTPTPNEDDDTAEGRRMDEELRALGQIIRILNGLDAQARSRSVRWLADRYDANPPV